MKTASLLKQLDRYEMPTRLFGLPENKVGSNEWIFRRLITNMIVSGSNEINTLKASSQIFDVYKNSKGLAKGSNETIIAILNKNAIRRSKTKAQNVIDAAKYINNTHKGIVPDTRAELETIKGVGRHTASIVLALAFGKPALGVDLHVRRIAKRIGMVDEKASDLAIENALMKGIKPENYGKFSRAFVDFGKDICAHDPDCANCFLKPKCETGLNKKITKAKTTISKNDGVYQIVAGSSDREYTVTIKNGRAACNCKGYRFRRTCSHTQTVEQ